MSDSAPTTETPLSIAGCWQIPLLGVGLLLLGAGIHRMAAAYRPVSYEEELAKVRTLQEAGLLRRANAYLLDLLQEERRPQEQRAELHRLLARTILQVESDIHDHARQNVKSIHSNYQSAIRLGAVLAADDWVAMGDAYGWSDSHAEAVAAYRRALECSPDRPDRIRRKIVEIELVPAAALSSESLADLDAMITGERDAAGKLHAASPDNYFWAASHKIEWLLEQGGVPAARELAEQAAERLAGTAEFLAVSYLRALCLHAEGKTAEAEAELRALRSKWTIRDELWARSGWLLGRLHQERGQVEAARSFYEEVGRSFRTGDVYDACVLGRAECQAALHEYEAALEDFESLKDLLSVRPNHPYVRRDAVRTTLATIGESLLQDGQAQSAEKFLRLGLDLTEPSAADLAAYYESRIAECLTRRAKDLTARTPAGGEQFDQANQLYAEAGEMYFSLAKKQTLDEETAARSLELAADNFDQAGRTERLIETLTRFIQEHPTHERRVTAFYRLGRANQALQRYPEAVAAYGAAASLYPRLPDAMRSMIPLADCLLRMGGEHTARGAELLISIVDDRGPEMLFAPQAREYRDALVLLAEYYCRADEEEVPEHFEKAIVRLETILAHYPDDPQVPKVQFLLADAYRHSGLRLRKEAESLTSESQRRQISAETADRLRRALDAYGEVIALLAPLDADSLAELEQAYLRTSYLCRGDCLFDLGEYAPALEAYREAAWRYDNSPAALSAAMQIVHCHLRLGQAEEAGAALARLKWLLAKIPETAFKVERGMSSKRYWEEMVDRIATAGVY